MLLGEKYHQEPISDKSYSLMRVMEHSIAGTWCGGLLFIPMVNLKNVSICAWYKVLMILIVGAGINHPVHYLAIFISTLL